MATTTITQTRTKSTPVSSTERCCDCGCVKQACTCCELTCFERPDYHCGHLLTDADLSLQVRYVVEKNKLRNRTLHGHGVVCGLKLTCDPDCCDHILVHEGYAIDACGNDIVVCETTCFDVLAALRAENLIAKAEVRDRCKPEVEEQECHVPQCFYITICYEEEDTEFQTPFQSSCASGPQDCVPTRIKERFRLEVTDRLPEQDAYLDCLEAKLKQCFRLFLDSPVGRLIKTELAQLKQIASGNAQRTTGKQDKQDKICELFCLLKAQFQQQIKQHPDQLSCDLAKQVACLTCPDEKGNKYAPAMQDAFGKLFKLMHQYQYDCVLAELVFSCEAPKEGGCIVLGCVEVDDCCVLRISNTHRNYVWSFANILQILVTTILTAKIEQEEAKDWQRAEGAHCSNTCCDDFIKFDHEAFLKEFEVNAAGRYFAATAPVRALREVHKSLADNFAFTDSLGISPALFANANPLQVANFAELLGLSATTAEGTVELASLNMLQAIISESLMRRKDALRIYRAADGTIRAVTPDYARDVSPERNGLSLEGLHALITERDQTIAELRTNLTNLQTRVANLEPRLGTPTRPA